MEWIQAITVILSVFGLVSGVLLFVMREMNQIGRDMNASMKDFHGRLCRLEEKYHQMEKK